MITYQESHLNSPIYLPGMPQLYWRSDFPQFFERLRPGQPSITQVHTSQGTHKELAPWQASQSSRFHTYFTKEHKLSTATYYSWGASTQHRCCHGQKMPNCDTAHHMHCPTQQGWENYRYHNGRFIGIIFFFSREFSKLKFEMLLLSAFAKF